MREAEKIGNQMLEDLKEPMLVEIPVTWRDGALVFKVADVMGDRGAQNYAQQPDNPIDELLKRLAEFKEQDKHIVKAFLMGVSAHAKFMQVAETVEEIKSQLWPVGGVLIFVDELFLSPNTAIPLYKRPKDLRDARRIWAEQINEALGTSSWEPISKHNH